jgi:hypothetical protein
LKWAQRTSVKVGTVEYIEELARELKLPIDLDGQHGATSIV